MSSKTRIFGQLIFRVCSNKNCYIQQKLLHPTKIVASNKNCYIQQKLLHPTKIVASNKNCYIQQKLLHPTKIVASNNAKNKWWRTQSDISHHLTIYIKFNWKLKQKHGQLSGPVSSYNKLYIVYRTLQYRWQWPSWTLTPASHLVSRLLSTV